MILTDFDSAYVPGRKPRASGDDPIASDVGRFLEL